MTLNTANDLSSRIRMPAQLPIGQAMPPLEAAGSRDATKASPGTPRELPLATTGTLGTRLNAIA